MRISAANVNSIRATDSTKVGSFIGDHTKTSIGTLLNTGSWIGMGCNLMATGSVLPKYIPSFVWYINGKITKGFGFNATLETAKTSMSRRKVELTDAMAALLRKVSDDTKSLRRELARKDRKRR